MVSSYIVTIDQTWYQILGDTALWFIYVQKVKVYQNEYLMHLVRNWSNKGFKNYIDSRINQRRDNILYRWVRCLNEAGDWWRGSGTFTPWPLFVRALDNWISANFSPSPLHSAIVAIFPPLVTVNGGPNWYLVRTTQSHNLIGINTPTWHIGRSNNADLPTARGRKMARNWELSKGSSREWM